MTDENNFMGFDISICNDQSVFPQLGDIARQYFSVDTATPDTAYEWYRHNPWAVITAGIGNTIHGFADCLPLSSEAVALIESGELIEEDIRPEHILPPEAMRYSKALYFSGIAVRDKGTFLGARCAVALVAGYIHLLEQVYGNSSVERIYTNPTTYSGNRLTQRIGFAPIKSHTRKIGGMDLYSLNWDPEQRANLNELYEAYHPLISSVDFALDDMPVLPYLPR